MAHAWQEAATRPGSLCSVLRFFGNRESESSSAGTANRDQIRRSNARRRRRMNENVLRKVKLNISKTTKGEANGSSSPTNSCALNYCVKSFARWDASAMSDHNKTYMLTKMRRISVPERAQSLTFSDNQISLSFTKCCIFSSTTSSHLCR